MRSPKKPPPPEITFRLHHVQRKFYECEKIYCAYTGGVGSGKSFVGCFELLTRAPPGSLVAVVAPTYRMLEDTTQKTFVAIATQLGLWNESAFFKTAQKATLNNQTEVLFRSGDDPDKLAGTNLARAYLDEAGMMVEKVFSTCIARLRYGGRQGRLTATFTPKGKDHWTYRLFSDQSNPNVALFRSSTRDNPFLAPEFYDNLLMQYGLGEGGMLLARQELEGEFVCVEGAEWPIEWFGRQVWFDEWPDDDQAVRAIALDSSKGIGGKTGDYSVFAIGMVSNGHLYVEFDMDNTRNACGMASRAIELQKVFNPHVFGIESEFGGNVLVDDLAVRAEQENIMMPLALVPTGGVQKDVRIRRLTPYLARGIVHFRNTEQTRMAVQGFESWPHSAHDDAPDALEMLVRVINDMGEF